MTHDAARPAAEPAPPPADATPGDEADAPPSVRHSATPDAGGTHARPDAARMAEDFKWRFLTCAALTVPIVYLSEPVQTLLGLGIDKRLDWAPGIVLGLGVAIYLYGCWPFVAGAAGELRRARPGAMTLVAFGVTTAFANSAAGVLGAALMPFFWATVALINLALLGHWVEMRCVAFAGRAPDTFERLLPETAHRLEADGEPVDVPAAHLVPGDRLLVRPGERVPADGRVVRGESAVDESVITGERVLVEKTAGARVLAGAHNRTGSLVVDVERSGPDTFLEQLGRLVAGAQASTGRAQMLADRAAVGLTLLALAAGAATFAGWILLSPRGPTFAVERAVTVIVAACPHAIGLAIPLVAAVSTRLGARAGLLVRNRAVFDRAHRLDTVVFNKTGTLTDGRFAVTDVLLPAGGNEEDVLALAAAVERASDHPIAAGILRSAQERGLAIPQIEAAEPLPGRGAGARVDGRDVRVLSASAVREAGLVAPLEAVAALEAEGRTVVWLVDDGRVAGALALVDRVRPTAAEAVASLHAMGLRVVMLTGDRAAVAAHVAAAVGIDRVEAEARPEEKAARVGALQREGLVVAVAGDGVHDAAALARAGIGIAVGAGADLAVEAADVVLVGSDPRNVVRAVRLARATHRKMVQNLWWAAGYNVVALPLAAGALAWAGVVLPPAAGAVLMSFATIAVAVNARRLRLDA